MLSYNLAIPECTFSRLFKPCYTPKHENAGKSRVLAINALLHSFHLLKISLRENEEIIHFKNTIIALLEVFV